MPPENNFAKWYHKNANDVFNLLQSRPSGLNADEVAERNREFGPNEIESSQTLSAIKILLRQFTDFMIVVLLIAAVISGYVGDLSDTLVILAIVVLNATIGFYQEYRAGRAMEALKKMAASIATVIRNGLPHSIPASEIVPGDVVLLEAGNIVPADLRLFEARLLKVEEASLTGESVPVEKQTAPIDEQNLMLADCLNMAFKGTLVASGNGMGVAVATGMHTELGKIAQMLEKEEVQTPLQKRLAAFSRKLALIFLFICVIVFFLGILRGEKPVLMLLTALSLAVAAIPEAMPAMVTISLSLGAKRMVKNNALVRRLPAVETLGSVTYICSDKTGTLTQNKMSAEGIIYKTHQYDSNHFVSFMQEPDAQWLLTAAALNNDIQTGSEGNLLGDPTEKAMYEFALQFGYPKNALLKQYPKIADIPFDATRKCMTTIHALDNGTFISFTKGAMDTLLPNAANLSQQDKANWEKSVNSMSANGFRVLGFAMRTLQELPNPLLPENIEQNFTLLGALGLIDPPRPEAAQSVHECKTAGIHTVMITGDHPQTARYIAQKLGIVTMEDDLVVTGSDMLRMTTQELESKVAHIKVYARVTPEQKFAIVEALQKKGQFVAMTGDGVNDAPSLKHADIGVAMAITGTDVAKEAAHMILLDDNFATIVKAVREGRRIFDNIRKFVKFIMTGNSAEIWTILLAPFFGLPIPLQPIHILWINLVTDGLPSLALAAEPAEKNIMNRPPRHPKESIFANGLGWHIFIIGLLIGGLTLLTQYISYHSANVHWQTMVFCTLCFCQLALALAIRSEKQSVFKQNFFSNPFLLITILVTVLIQLGIVYIPVLNGIFKTKPLSATELLFTFVPALIIFVAVEIGKLIDNTKKTTRKNTPKKLKTRKGLI
ncbi:cation-translocating P-type ATPase [Sphingobacteriales bacterium UPWRP_1]|nr:cation-translocating P-type ATPase [Sphingobacteriales bacterium UPWRP_1]